MQQAKPFDEIWIEGRAEEDRTLPAAGDDEDGRETQILQLRPDEDEDESAIDGDSGEGESPS